MPGRRRLESGYQAPTLRRRIQEIMWEPKAMGEDGRLPREVAMNIHLLLLQAYQVVDEAIRDYPSAAKPTTR